jgi:hypothetical protein
MANDHQHLILGVHITDRLEEAPRVQAVFTEFGCNIKTRIGLHDTDGELCSGTGVVLLELVGGKPVADEMAARLAAIAGVHTQLMVFAD